MKRYIAYFDFLGYKEFILNNTVDHVRNRVGHILRDIETSLSDDLKVSAHNRNLIADLEGARVHCLNISDTIIFYTNDDSLDSFEDLINVAYKFNWRSNRYNFPVRGIVTLEEFEMISDTYTNEQQISYRPNIMYGKGLVLSHIKCETQQWAGCCVDNAVVETVEETDKGEVLHRLAIKYEIPLKENKGEVFSTYALRLYTGGLNDEALKNMKDSIIDRFKSDKKSIEHASVNDKLENTLNFIEFLKDK